MSSGSRRLSAALLVLATGLTVSVPVSAVGQSTSPRAVQSPAASLAPSGAAWSPGQFPDSSPGASIMVAPISAWNDTDRWVTVSLDGVPITRLGPHSEQDPITLTSVPPPRPWDFVVETDSGFVLDAYTVDWDGPFSFRTYLACGTIDVWSITPILGPYVSPPPVGCGP